MGRWWSRSLITGNAITIVALRRVSLLTVKVFDLAGFLEWK